MPEKRDPESTSSFNGDNVLSRLKNEQYLSTLLNTETVSPRRTNGQAEEYIEKTDVL